MARLLCLAQKLLELQNSLGALGPKKLPLLENLVEQQASFLRGLSGQPLGRSKLRSLEHLGRGVGILDSTPQVANCETRGFVFVDGLQVFQTGF